MKKVFFCWFSSNGNGQPIILNNVDYLEIYFITKLHGSELLKLHNLYAKLEKNLQM